MNAIDKALERSGLGLTELARKMGAKPQLLSNWRVRGVPPPRVIDLEIASGLPRHEIRPDIYPAPTQERQVQLAGSSR